MVLIGLKARWAALVLVVFTACTIIFVHHFWDMAGEAIIANRTEALKYLSIMGGLLLIVGGRLRSELSGAPLSARPRRNEKGRPCGRPKLNTPRGRNLGTGRPRRNAAEPRDCEFKCRCG